MSFYIKNTGIAAFADTSGKSDTANSASVTDVSLNSVGYQTLTYTFSLTNVSITNTKVINLGKIPLNAIVFSTVSYSSGLSASSNGNTINLSDTNFNFALYAAQNVNEGSTNSLTLNSPLTYPDCLSGIYIPSSSNPSYPLIITSDSNDIYEYLNLEMNWDQPDDLTISGDIIIRMSIIQSNPNNTSQDNYPTGGINSGPVNGTQPFPTPV